MTTHSSTTMIRRNSISYPLATALHAHLDQVLHTLVFPGLTRLNSEGAMQNKLVTFGFPS